MKKLLSILVLFISYYSIAQTPINVTSAINNTSVSTCNGFIIDSGGQGGTGYSNGENITFTICPDTPGDYMTVVFNLFNLSLQDDNPAPNQTNVDYMYVYDGNTTAGNSLGVYQGTELQGVVIQASPQNTSGCLTFTFVSNSGGTGAFTASALCETPCSDPVAAGVVLNGITSDSIHVCIGEVVNFQDAGSFAQPGFAISDYSWDFMDGTSATGQNVSHTYTVPGHYRVQLFVTDDNADNDCVNNNLIDLQVLVATIPTFIGFISDTTLCLGESLVATSTPNDYELLWDGFSGYETIDDGCLLDTQLGVAQNIDILQTGFAAGTTITSASQIQEICLELEHSFMGDLVIYLNCPNGQSIMLHQQGGGGTQLGVPIQADNVDCTDPATQGTPYNYCFTPAATQTWVQWVNTSGFGGTLPAGNYQPIGAFTDLVGCPTNGVWTLTVVDNWAADDGVVFSFGLTLDPSLYPDLVQFTPQIGLSSDSSFWNMPAQFVTNVSADGDAITINPTSAGSFTYTYTVIDNFGCTNDSSFVLTVNDNPLPNAGNDVIVCGGTPEQLNGSISGAGGGSPCPYTLDLVDSFGDSWNGNNLLLTVNGVTTTYTVSTGSSAIFTVNIPHGASVTSQFQASGNWTNECEYQIIDPNGAVVVQQGQNGTTPPTTVDAFTADCFGGYEFVWSPSGDLNDPNIPNPIGTFLSPQTLTLTVYPTGHPLCATTDQMNITLSNSAFPGEDSTFTICSAGAAVDLFPVLGPGASVNGYWVFGAANTPVTMPYDPVTMNPGQYKYRVDSAGCISQAIITVIEVSTSITTVVPTDVNCNSASNGSIVVTGLNFTSYSIDGGPQFAATSPATINGFAAGNYTLEVFGTGGCSDTEPFVIAEPAPLQLDLISNDTSVCVGASIAISALGSGGSTAYTYTWTQNGSLLGIGTPITVTPPLTTNTYCVTLTEACGSPAVDTCMTIDNPVEIFPVLTPDTTRGCFPVTINFANTTNSNEIATTLVDFGDGQIISYPGPSSFSHIYAQPGVYTVHVEVTSIFGCLYDSTFTNMIEAFDYPEANFNILPNDVSFFDPNVYLENASSSNVVSYQWTISSGNPASAFTENVNASFPSDVEGGYPVTLLVTDQNNCQDTITKIVNVISEVVLYAPNSFTPDGDEHNQTWKIVVDGIDLYSAEILIFNRWGEVIWECHDVSEGWDGTYGGKVVQNGTYTWTLKFRDIHSDKKYEFSGHILLIR